MAVATPVGDTYMIEAVNFPNDWGPTVFTIDGIEELGGGPAPSGMFINEIISPFAGIPGGVTTESGVLLEFERPGFLFEFQSRTADGRSINNVPFNDWETLVSDLDFGSPTTIVAKTLYFYFLHDGAPLSYPAMYGAGGAEAEPIGAHPLEPSIQVFYDVTPAADIFLPDGKITFNTFSDVEFHVGTLEAALDVSPINGVRLGFLYEVVPEPSALALAGLGLIWLIGCRRQRSTQA